jgi:heme exporter protein D
MDWGKFFEMGGYGLYVWGSYVVTAIAMISELLLLRNRKRTLARKDGQ